MQDIVETEFAIPPTELEQHVRRSWQQISRDDERPLSRTTTMNLVAVAPVEDEALLRSALQRLFRSSPCLAFLVLLSGVEQPLEASFGTHVAVGRKSRRVLLERVTLRASRSEQRRIASLVRPLLLDDLPTQFFWATAMPEDARLLHALGSLADQVVYDSTLFADPAADTRRMTALGLRAVDLTALRMRPWRQTLAEAFEHVPWRKGQPVEVTIHHADAAGTRAAVCSLALWLQQRLGATIREETTRDGHAPSTEPSALLLRTGPCTIRIEHGWPAPQLRVTLELPGSSSVPYDVVSPPLTRGDLLAHAAEDLGVIAGRTS